MRLISSLLLLALIGCISCYASDDSDAGKVTLLPNPLKNKEFLKVYAFLQVRKPEVIGSKVIEVSTQTVSGKLWKISLEKDKTTYTATILVQSWKNLYELK